MHHRPNGADTTMPKTRNAPRKTARRIARKRLRESGQELVPDAAEVARARLRHADENLKAANAAAAQAALDAWKAGVDPDEGKKPEIFCQVCDRELTDDDGRHMRGDRAYCSECASRPLPTHAEMLAFMARAFDVVATVVRDNGSALYQADLQNAIVAFLDNQPAERREGLAFDTWQDIASVWDRLAYRPLGAV
jgi:hypothetical protein